MKEPVRVGLVGAGPWAQVMHAPMLAAGPETLLSGVWARRPEAAAELAAQFDVAVFRTYDDLLEASDAVAFAVPPDAQADMAIKAAHQGRHLLLEKPLALDLATAERLTQEVAEAGVVSQVVLINRYTRKVEDFIRDARAVEPVGARCAFLSGAITASGMFATPWRKREGVLLDAGPHVIDLLQAVLGPIVRVSAMGDPVRWTSFTAEHASGAVSDASLSFSLQLEENVFRCEVYGPTLGAAIFSRSNRERGSLWHLAGAEVCKQFAEAIRTNSRHRFDVAHVFQIQKVIEACNTSLAEHRHASVV